MVMPPVRIRDNMNISPEHYRVKIRGAVIDEGEVQPDLLMAMDSGLATGDLEGIRRKEPAFGLDAEGWKSSRVDTNAAAASVCTPRGLSAG